jgi:hypothetical protein
MNSEIKKKAYRAKKKIIKKPPGLYDIDNFVVQHSVKKLDQKTRMLNIPIPVYKELDNLNTLDIEDYSESVYLSLTLGRYLR